MTQKESCWPRVRIGEVCALIVDCINKTAPSTNTPTPYKMIRTSNVRSGRVDLGEVRYVSEQVFRKWTRRGQPRIGDIVLTREAPLGEVGMLRSTDEVFLGQRLVMYRADSAKLNNRFLLYSFLGDDLQGQIKSFGSGATVEHMRVPDCENLTIPLPHLETQHKIAAILSAYDDLIENNIRRIKILEELVQVIYREWFIHFQFPGHENIRMINSSIGSVPERWSVMKVTEAVSVNPQTVVPKQGKKPFAPMSSMANDSMLIEGIQYRAGNDGSKFRNGDTLFARITPCLENGKTGFVQFLPSEHGTAFGSTEFIVLRSKSLCPEYVYLMARSDTFRDHAIKSMSGATGRQRVQEACFARFLIAHPDKQTIETFHATVSPIFKSVHALARKNATLRQTRDLLLPKLISGEVDVSELHISGREIDS
jgi:type I restriction enzyme S subunit